MKSFKEFKDDIKLEESAPGLVKHRIGVTVSDPHSDSVAQRKEKVQKFIRVAHSDDKEGARKVAEKHFKKKGWKVHDSWHAGIVNEEVELNEEKIPVQHAIDSVHKVLGNKSAVSFIGHLKPGTEKHTSWNNINNALTKQGVQPHHIAKIASHVKPAQFKEEVELEEAKDTVTKDSKGNVVSWSHEGDWKKSNPKKDPEGKVHNLVGNALKKTKEMAKEEVELEEVLVAEYEQLDEISKKTAASYINKASKSAAALATTAMHFKNVSRDADKEHDSDRSSEYSKYSSQTTDKQLKRLKGIDTAVKKLTKEEVELEEARRGTFRMGSKSMFKAGQAVAKNIQRAEKERKEKEKQESSKIDEVLNPEQGAGEYVKDFKKSDAPQFQGKSQSKRKEMAIAAYLNAVRKNK